MGNIYRGTFTVDDLVDSATVSLVAGQYIKVGERQITAGELIALGYGLKSGQESAEGRIFMNIRDNNDALIPGTVRIVEYTPQDRPIKIVDEFRTETLVQGDGDRTKQLPYPEKVRWLSEDKKYVLEIKADSNVTLTKANCEILIDVTNEAI